MKHNSADSNKFHSSKQESQLTRTHAATTVTGRLFGHKFVVSLYSTDPLLDQQPTAATEHQYISVTGRSASLHIRSVSAPEDKTTQEDDNDYNFNNNYCVY